MAEDQPTGRRPRFWITLIAVIILLIFLYFYAPFEKFLVGSIPNIHFSNVIFWFASVVGVIAYAVAHWSSFRRNIYRQVNELDVGRLVFDSLQVAILAEHLMGGGPLIDAGFAENLMSIILLVILALLFYLLHHVVRGFRDGWHTRRPPPRVTNSQ